VPKLVPTVNTPFGTTKKNKSDTQVSTEEENTQIIKKQKRQTSCKPYYCWFVLLREGDFGYGSYNSSYGRLNLATGAIIHPTGTMVHPWGILFWLRE